MVILKHKKNIQKSPRSLSDKTYGTLNFSSVYQLFYEYTPPSTSLKTEVQCSIQT